MSGVLATVRPVIHLRPWLSALRDGWELRRHKPEDDPDMGFTVHSECAVSLRTDLSALEERCTVGHECVHIDRGQVPVLLVAREEQRVRRIACRLLLPDIHAIGEAMAWALSTEEAARELDVDYDTLRDRLRWLHPAERWYLHRRLEGL